MQKKLRLTRHRQRFLSVFYKERFPEVLFQDFFKKCPEKYVIIISEFAVYEIEKIIHYSKAETLNLIKEMKIETEFVEATEKDHILAKELTKKGIH